MGQFLHDQNYMKAYTCVIVEHVIPKNFGVKLPWQPLFYSQMLESVCDEVWLTVGPSGHPQGVGFWGQGFVRASRALWGKHSEVQFRLKQEETEFNVHWCLKYHYMLLASLHVHIVLATL